MSVEPDIVPFLLFEVAGCLMAVPASEISSYTQTGGQTPSTSMDLDVYFGGGRSEGPWLRWARGTRQAWLRVRRVIDVVPVSLAALTPMPRLLRVQRRTRAFLAAGVRGQDVFLLLDPARLVIEPATATDEPR